MRLQPRHALLVVSLVLSAAIAEGHELQIGLSQKLEGDSNVTATAKDSKSDGIWIVEPEVSLRKRSGEFLYDVEYRPRIETYFETDGIDGVDHTTRGEYSWQPNGRHTFTAAHSFSDTRSVFLDDLDPTTNTQLEYSDRLRVKRLFIDGGYTYAMAADWQAGLSTRYEHYDYSSGNLVNNDAFGGNAQITHALTPTLTLGTQVGGRHRIYDETSRQPGSTTTTANVSFFGQWSPVEHWSLEVSGGPTMIWSQTDDVGSRTRLRYYPFNNGAFALTEASCDPVPNTSLLFLSGCQASPTAGTGLLSVIDDTQTISGSTLGSGGDDTDLTYFASVTLRRAFEHGEVTAVYERFETGASGAATATIADSVVLRGRWVPEKKWSLTARFSWRREKTVGNREQTVELVAPSSISSNPGFPLAPRFVEFAGLAAIPVSQRLDVRQYRVNLSAIRKLTQNLNVTAGLGYLRVERNDTKDDFDVYRGYVGVAYTFDPWIF